MKATATPALFAHWASRGKWRLARHLSLLDSAIIDAVLGRAPRLIVTMPPRHGKSVLISQYTAPWFLGNWPDKRVMLASYEADFAASWGRKGRGVLEEYGHEAFGVRVSGRSSAADRWDIEGHDGGMMTAGVGGAMTGKGAHLLIIDDPVKNSEEANSFVYRQKTWDWYQSTAYTRLEPDGVIILVQTRWHGDDLAGRIIKESLSGGESWRVVNLPAIAGPEDALGRAPGEALWPTRFSAKRLLEIRKSVGEYVWASLYQQSPTSDEGNKIKREWLRYYEMQGRYYRLFRPGDEKPWKVILDSDCQRFQIIDAAGTSEDVSAEKRGKAPNWSVITTIDFHRDTGLMMVRDVCRGRWDFPGLCGKIGEQYKIYQPAWIGVEDASNGKPALQTLRHLPMRAISHEGKDKLVRAARLLNEMEQGKVFLAQSATWRQELEAELLNWTGHKDEQDDQIDTLAYAGLHADRQRSTTVTLEGGFFMGRL